MRRLLLCATIACFLLLLGCSRKIGNPPPGWRWRSARGATCDSGLYDSFNVMRFAILADDKGAVAFPVHPKFKEPGAMPRMALPSGTFTGYDGAPYFETDAVRFPNCSGARSWADDEARLIVAGKIKPRY